MLSDQRSPYVGRFARDWHRLPGGPLPGNHRPRLGHRRIIATGWNRASERARPGQHADLACSGSAKGERARRDGGPARQHVVDEQDPPRDGAGRRECAPERLPPRQARTPGLGRRFDNALQQSPRRPAHRLRHGPSQRFGLVVATRSTPRGAERHPGDGGPFGIHLGRRRPGQRPHHPRSDGRRSASKPGELQSHERGPNGPLVQKGGPRPRDWRWRTVRAAIDRLLQRPAARSAPGRYQQGDVRPARTAERPRPAPAAHAGRGEEDVQHSAEHGRSVRPGSDTECEPGSAEVHRSRTGTGCDREPETSRTTTSRRRACRGTG